MLAASAFSDATIGVPEAMLSSKMPTTAPHDFKKILIGLPPTKREIDLAIFMLEMIFRKHLNFQNYEKGYDCQWII